MTGEEGRGERWRWERREDGKRKEEQKSHAVAGDEEEKGTATIGQTKEAICAHRKTEGKAKEAFPSFIIACINIFIPRRLPSLLPSSPVPPVPS